MQFTASHPVEVMGDPVRLRQVIDNLLANVRAHTPPGTASTVRVDQEGETAEIVVRDAGPGMPTEEAARVFERFYRADASRARSHGGSGLGLRSWRPSCRRTAGRSQRSRPPARE